MKYDHYKQNIKFERKINHLQSLTGMPMWNGRNPSISQIRAYERRLMEQQTMETQKKKESLFQQCLNGLRRRVSGIQVKLSQQKPKNKMRAGIITSTSKIENCC